MILSIFIRFKFTLIHFVFAAFDLSIIVIITLTIYYVAPPWCAQFEKCAVLDIACCYDFYMCIQMCVYYAHIYAHIYCTYTHRTCTHNYAAYAVYLVVILIWQFGDFLSVRQI